MSGKGPGFGQDCLGAGSEGDTRAFWVGLAGKPMCRRWDPQKKRTVCSGPRFRSAAGLEPLEFASVSDLPC